MKDVTERKGLDGNKNLHLSDLQNRHYQRSCEVCRHAQGKIAISTCSIVLL